MQWTRPYNEASRDEKRVTFALFMVLMLFAAGCDISGSEIMRDLSDMTWMAAAMYWGYFILGGRVLRQEGEEN